MPESIGLRLEQYTLKRRQEVLIVDLETATGELDRVTIFAGFSSSLMKATNFDPDVPVIAADSKIISVDRLTSPYDPNNPQYIESGLTGDAIENILQELGL
ncbi:hypothetical protein I4641_17110 [Waterburya agarophytonicola K14]|uniref:DUF7734 domain-containing protein n=1 Tax=Waterburya agarophytonicola KI4 TaxID=2874699 RepID=A0A964FH43_9CYAN|nr:hypothetical protein [Waterburya agarophytonicola KI4]